ncbi:L-seryl-tRNA(Sec) selenium transferase [Anaerobacillus sp. MEB173]|uniref:L-seryl-tRNA(Sec) selenium transferase n=1 Tax=Anaerobacillus sp. MEB173 TaxID=3383345 RepID=UPI003F8EA390
MKQYLRELPAIHLLQSDERFDAMVEEKNIPYHTLTEWVQAEIEHIRHQLLSGEWESEEPTKALFITKIFDAIEQKAEGYQKYQLRKVINGTGTILHTNLGRARLSEEAIRQVTLTAENYSNLEYNIAKGARGSRHDIVEETIKRVTGAEAAMVVNNNAAAVYLILRALAQDKEVIVSRGQLVEIGGSFRVSSIMEESGAKLVEVGTTNKTHLYDYERAANEETAMILKVHTSNFKTVGFTAEVDTKELAQFSAKNNLIFYEDLGSGALYDFSRHGIGDEPVVSEVLKMGVDLVSFSGDKLLGGPQAGIIAGKKELVAKLKKHQLARVLRVDKMTLAALEATIGAYEHGTDELHSIPTVRDILLTVEEVRARASAFHALLRDHSGDFDCEIKEDTSQIGGGTMPTVEIPTVVVTIKHKQLSTQKLFDHLRLGDPVVITRMKEDQLMIDFRTVSEEESGLIVQRLTEVQ